MYLWLGVAVYVAGVAWGLFVFDARPVERLILALLWPLGPIAFVVTLTILLAASVLAFPLVMVPALLLIGLAWWRLLL